MTTNLTAAQTARMAADTIEYRPVEEPGTVAPVALLHVDCRDTDESADDFYMDVDYIEWAEDHYGARCTIAACDSVPYWIVTVGGADIYAMPERHELTIDEPEPTTFQRRNGLAPNLTARCSCGWSAVAIFPESARAAAARHIKGV